LAAAGLRQIAGSVQCTINGLKDEITLPYIEAETGATIIHIQRNIIGSPKVTNVDLWQATSFIIACDSNRLQTLHPS
jgi:hypothetical protein